MTPTPKLRFVERNSYLCNGEFFSQVHKVTILQQWWEPEQNIIDMVAGKTKGEWRDVPLEAEDFTQNKTSG